MSGVYQAGTVYVDVVPSMKGFFKSIENATAAQIPQVASDAGKKYAEKGSSPRGRGKLHRYRHGQGRHGLIPARAGKTGDPS